ncbi:MAG: PP2C family serine/threonine-protein phosphatase [Paludibacteraceae bacterium]
MSIITNLLELCGIQASLAQGDDFQKWLINEAWNRYNKSRMDNKIIIENKIKDLGIRLANGTVRKDYAATFTISKDLVEDFWIDGCDRVNLKCEISDDNECTLTGKPMVPGDFTLTLYFKCKGWIEGEELSSINLPIAFNPDPRTLWKNIPTSENIPFFKPDSEVDYVRVEEKEETGPRKDIVAASQRGRSHAQEGKARDDHFKLFHCDESDWYIIAVADGAGSAKFSRKGSEIACNVVVDFCKEKLLHSEDFEKQIIAYNNAEDEEKARKDMANTIYSIIGNAAFKAHKSIKEASNDNNGTSAKDFATTLMFAICKKFEFGWFVASYWVGDGAMAILNEEKNTIKLLGVPDEGEYSGQTRFLTMPEIFKDGTAVFDRLRFSIEDDFTALMLMTDGVSDPMFETENNLNDVEKWKEFWNKLKTGFPDDEIGGVDLSDDNEESKNQLLGWLNFWSAGNHDDRTLAILY